MRIHTELPRRYGEELNRDYVVTQLRHVKHEQWPKVSLRDLVDLRISNVDKKTVSGEHSVRLCNYVDVYRNQFISADSRFLVATATEQEIAKCALIKGDVVITKDSEAYDDIGVPAFVPETIPNLVCGYHLAILRSKSAVLDGQYLFYALSTYEAQQQFHSMANGVTRFGLRKDDIKRVEIAIPPLSHQRTIAHVLGTLDNKIELNRRICATLEEMARALFRSWFVDFDPVKAKIQCRWRRGESLPGLPAELYDRVPDRLVPSDFGLIPDGWSTGVLDELIDVLSGGTPKTTVPEYWHGPIPWYTAKDAPSSSLVFVLETERTVTPEGIANSATKILPAGTTVITARGSVGKLACLGRPMAMNQTCYGIRGKSGYADYFTYMNIKQALGQLLRNTHGTIFNTITRQTFKSIPNVIPPPEVTQVFENRCVPIMTRILTSLQSTQLLALLRDTLLPQLMSGYMRVDSI